MRIAVAGTGTEIGKTHVTCALARALSRTREVVALKPIESGGVEDARALSEACGVETLPHHALREPISPHLAARREGVTLVMDDVAAWVREREREVTLVETAGGLFSPLGPAITNASLVEALDPDVLLLVAPDRLGVLHDVIATLAAWGERTRARIVVALSAPVSSDASTSTNASELEALGVVRVASVFPRAPQGAAETVRAAVALADELQSAVVRSQ